MILTRTPLRISLFGGGTDLPAFYSRSTGRVLTAAIDKYIYVALKPRFDGKTRACYSQTELVDDPRDLNHDRIRAVFTKAHVSGVDVASFSDVPHNGTGLGTSSAFTVGLVRAVYALRGIEVEQYEVADEACKIEMVRCGCPIGKQDQHACARGGIMQLTFGRLGEVRVWWPWFAVEQFKRLREFLLLMHTGVERDGNAVLRTQTANLANPAAFAAMQRMAEQAGEASEIVRRGDLRDLGPMLHEAWMLKRSLADGISTPQIDQWYERAREAGAMGGKVLGAGGGGFLLFFADPDRHEAILKALSELAPLAFDWDFEGTRVVYQKGTSHEPTR